MDSQNKEDILPGDLTSNQHASVPREAERVKLITPGTENSNNTSSKEVENRGRNKGVDDRGWKMGTWNVRGLNSCGKLAEVCKEMNRMEIEILGLSETFWDENSDFITSIQEGKSFRVMTAGGGGRRRGVGFIVNHTKTASIKEVWRISERIIVIRVEGKKRNLLIIQVYAPTADSSEEDINDFYHQLEEIMAKKKFAEVVVIMGDWNAKVGQGREGNIVGPWGLGNRNERGELMIGFCTRHNLWIGNTWFEQRSKNRYTWKSPDGHTKNQIDYIITENRYKNCFKNCKVMTGVDCGSDHNPVFCRLQVKLKRQSVKDNNKKWNLGNSENKEKWTAFNCKLQQILETTVIRGLDSANDKWNGLKEIIHRTAEEEIGYQRQKGRKPWISEETLELKEERRKVKESDKEEYKRLNLIIRNKCRREKEKWHDDKCKDIEEMDKKHETCKIFRMLKDLQHEGKKIAGGIKSKQGTLLHSEEEIITRWEEYGRELYEGERHLVELGEPESETGPPILKEEIQEAIKRIKKGKSIGIDNLPIEFFMNMGNEAMEAFTELINNIYSTGDIPEDFKKSIMIPIPKKKNCTDCSNFRTISIITHASKILLGVILRRIRRKIEENIGEDQYGFRPNRGTRDGIMELKMVAERILRDGQEMHIGFVDFEKAFDRVGHEKLLDLLKKQGIDWKDQRIIKNLYWGQNAAFKINNRFTEWFEIKCGVRQGCMWSPSFFNLYSEELITEALRDIKGIKIGGENYNRIRYADDIAILTSDAAELERAMESLHNLGVDYGLKINASKTKTMVINKGGNKQCRVKINGTTIEQVKDFKYLGSTITEDGRCGKEIRTRIGMAKTAFWRQKELLRRDVNKTLKWKMLKCYVWSVFLYGCETWTLTKDSINRINAFDIWCARRMLRIKWTDMVRNVDVWRRIGKDYSLLREVMKRKWKYAGHIMRGSAGTRLITALEGWTKHERRPGRPRKQWTDDLKEWSNIKKYSELKSLAQDREKWRSMEANLRLGERT